MTSEVVVLVSGLLSGAQSVVYAQRGYRAADDRRLRTRSDTKQGRVAGLPTSLLHLSHDSLMGRPLDSGPLSGHNRGHEF